MYGVVSRLRRTVARLFRPLLSLARWRGLAMLGLSALSVLGLSTVAEFQQWWAVVGKPWLAANPALVTFFILFVLAIVALYGVEKEADRLRTNGIRIESHYVYQACWWKDKSLLTVDVKFLFFNNATLPTAVIVHEVLLQRKRGRSWESVPYDFVRVIEHHGPIYEEALIPARQQYAHVFSLAGNQLEGAESPTERDRLRIIFKIPGQPNEEAVVPLSNPRIIGG